MYFNFFFLSLRVPHSLFLLHSFPVPKLLSYPPPFSSSPTLWSFPLLKKKKTKTKRKKQLKNMVSYLCRLSTTEHRYLLKCGWYIQFRFIEQNWFSISQHEAIANSSLFKGGMLCPLLSFMLGFLLKHCLDYYNFLIHHEIR